jgi:hypothetical protein
MPTTPHPQIIIQKKNTFNYSKRWFFSPQTNNISNPQKKKKLKKIK